METLDNYNYAAFDIKREDPYFAAFRNQLHVGERALDFPLEDLSTGETVTLQSLWQQGPAIIEFGSFT